MEQSEAIKLAKTLIQSGLTHQDYKRVVEHARDYLAFISGEGVDKMLKKFVPRETDVMFTQRVELTQNITAPTCSSLIKPFNKVGRNDKVKQIIEVKGSPEKENQIKTMRAEFFGDARKQRGLDYWLKNRFVELTFSDPNSWLVIEWEQVGQSETPRPYPVEVSSEEALNFSIKNGILEWLFIKKEIQYLAIDGRSQTAQYKTGARYTLYDTDCTIVFTQVNKDYLRDEELLDESFIAENTVEIKGLTYRVDVYFPNTGYVTAIRIGYITDPVTKGRVFVSPLKPAEPYLRKTIKTVSEMDITMTLHAFPQKIQYVSPCEGESREKKCFMGKLADGAVCSACGGSGKKIQTSAQDAIMLPMPDQGQANIMSLENVLVYKSPPVDLLTFQKDYISDLKKDCHMAVFNSQVFIQSGVERTATEVDDNMESVYDTLELFTDKVSEVFTDAVNIFATIVNVDPDSDETNILHRYPADPKLKTTSILLNELKLVNDSKAPAFLRDAITNDIASIIYNGDPLGFAKYNTRRKFYPFNGRTSDEVATLLNSSYISERTKVLASNFDLIMNDIEKENAGFSLMTNDDKQWKIVEEVVDRYLLEIKDSASDVRPDFSALAPATDE